MKRTRTRLDPACFPCALRPLLSDAPVYDSSCSPEARVWLIERDEGYFLKTAAVGQLAKEAEMTRFLHAKHLAAEVFAYLSEGDRDYLLTARVPGEDCTHKRYLDDPKRLCDIVAEQLRRLHDLPTDGCPVPDRTAAYLSDAERTYRAGGGDLSLFGSRSPFAAVRDAFRVVEREGYLLRQDTLLHGDPCLPNILLCDWRFSGFVDLGNGGVGDRHIDLFWGAWTLWYNLGTDRYRDRFFDAYGRDLIEPELLRVIAAAEVFG